MCRRPVNRVSRHHLIPRSRHKNKRNKRMFTRGQVHHTVALCGPCHRHVHTVLTEKELERDYNTIEALSAHPEVEKFVGWIKDKPHGAMSDARRNH